MRKRFSVILWLLAILIPTVMIWDPGDRLLSGIADSRARKQERLRRSLEGRGLIFLADFDGSPSREWISGRHGLLSGTVIVPGRFGGACKFDGRERTTVDYPLEWASLGGRYTLSMWLKITGENHSQDIFYTSGLGQRSGWCRENGRMTFYVPGDAGQVASYPFTQRGRYVHLAAVVDEDAGSFRVYENGLERARGALASVRQPRQNLAFGKPLWFQDRYPFTGQLDDVAIWNRPLTENEVREIARAGKGLVSFYAAGRRRGLAMADRAWMLLRRMAGLRDLTGALTPEGYQALAASRNLPEIRLRMTGATRRRLLSAHHRSRRSGRRIQSGARRRPVFVGFRGKSYAAQINLHGSNIQYSDVERPSLELLLEEDAGWTNGSRRLRLRPPETGHWLWPETIARCRRRMGLPAIEGGFYRLKINDKPCGIYSVDAYDSLGILPGDLAGVAEGFAKNPTQWQQVMSTTQEEPWERMVAVQGWPGLAEVLQDAFHEVRRDRAALLKHDLQSPLTGREIRQRIQDQQMRVEAYVTNSSTCTNAAAAAADFLDEYMLLGRNLSPQRVVSSLELDKLKLPGISIVWQAGHPGRIAANGTVTRPDTGPPVASSLTAVLDDGVRRVARDLYFRVMPRHVSLPAVLLTLRDTVSKTRRVDAAVSLCEAGEDETGRRLLATQHGRGGVSHRGNSSYWYAKKLLAIKTDRAHRVFGDDGRRHLLTVNSLQDPTFVRNGLAYGMYRDWSEPGCPRPAPRVRPAEIFINGRYHGLFELCTRIDDILLDESMGTEVGDRAEPRWIVYRFEKVRPREPIMRAIRPPPHRGLWQEPFVDLRQWLRSLPDAEADWPRELARRIDVPGMIDLQLLLNLTQNLNGQPFLFPLHEALVYDRSRDLFTQVPWDFDILYMPEFGWIQNDTMRLCERSWPDYRTELRRRWKRLRQHTLAFGALQKRIDRLAQPIEGYVEWDFQRWHYGGEDHGTMIDALKNAVSNHIMRMDAHLAVDTEEM